MIEYTKKDALLSLDKRYRFRLERHWDGGVGLVTWIMLNPSTADADEDDATIRRCVAFSKSWGFCGMVVVNLYAWRATDPKELYAAEAEGKNTVGSCNDGHILRATREADLVIAAWGAATGPIEGRTQRLQVFIDNLHDLGVTKDGHPKHPLYLPASTKPQRRKIATKADLAE